MANGQYHGTIPGITQAYQNDPRTKLAAQALMQGTSTAPVAGGGWAWADGLSRIGQAITGSLVNKSQEKKYSAREDEYIKAMQAAAALAGQPPQGVNPAMANPAQANPSGVDAAASALGGRVDVPQPGAVRPVEMPPSVPAQQAQRPPMMPGQGGPPQASAIPTQRPPMQPPFPMVEGGSAPLPDPISGGTGPSRGAAPINPSVLFRQGIVPIEGGTDRNGRFLTSPKGAYGPSQLMPGTAPEALELAGFRRDDPRWRTDAEVNLKAGEAYYAKQLQTFGDPVKAAAAYNAGPGNVRRAMRKAARTGSDWTQHLPDETKKYIVNFQNKVGAVSGADPAAMQAEVPPAQAEPVAQAPVAPPRPEAPALPDQVQTQRISMAQAMLNSGNPDLVTIAQTYLDKGLDEQQQNRTLSSQQQFAQGQTGYSADLNNWGNAQSDERGFKYGDIRDTKQRNWQSAERVAGQQYQSGERAIDRAYGTQERLGSQDFTAGQNAANRDWQTGERIGAQDFTAGQNQLDRGNKLDIAAQKRQQYFSTPDGRKLEETTLQGINQNNELIAKYERFMDINKRKATGGAALNAPVIGSLYTAIDDELQEMAAIANDTTFNTLGGLGTAISDGDRKFIEKTGVSTQTKGRANTNIARARIGVLRRTNEYLQNYAIYKAEGRSRDFLLEWPAFVKQNPIVTNGRATDRPMTFDEWKAKRPKYDASGKRVN